MIQQGPDQLHQAGVTFLPVQRMTERLSHADC